jgi:dimethylhistidine N-methyltransferase
MIGARPRHRLAMAFRLMDRTAHDAPGEREALAKALRARPAAIPPKYFYDALGCALYAAICELPEYYPTRAEAAIFATHRVDIANAIGTGSTFVDLGAGDGAKAESWLPFVVPARYVAVDFAANALERTLQRLAARFASTDLVGVVADFTQGLPLADALGDGAVTFFYPGSSIGNFAPDEAIDFLRRIEALCRGRPGSGLLIGVDTKKDRARLDAAYDDRLGVTAAFNRNVLNHVNRVLGSDFDVDAFAHRARYVAEHARIEMHLEALSDQPVRIGGQTRVFERGERIHTENSYKYTPDEFDALIACAGFSTVRRWLADDGDFVVFWAA